MSLISQISNILTDPGAMASILAGVAVFATAVSFMPSLQGDKLNTRLKSVTNRREQLRRQSRAEIEGKSLKRESKGFFSDLNEKFDLQKLLEDPNVHINLMRAGLRGPGPVAAFYAARMILPFVGLIVIFFYVFVLEAIQLEGSMKYGSLIAGMAAGYYMPNVYLKNVSQKRQQSIMQSFPDSLDMLLICVEAGMSIEMAFQKVSREIGTASPELAEELALTTAELSYLQERRLAYENLATRTGHEGVKGVCLALVQAERYGTPLGDALRVMAKENRDLRMSAAEKKAAALPAKLTVPMILFFLPVLFLVVLGPAYLSYKETQSGFE
ncbi:MAG: type II secretion system F family protein [Pseudomonadota bacterium]